MPNKTEISFTIGEQTHSIIKRLIDRVDQYDSTKKFYEVAIGSNGRKLQSISAGGEQARELILVLGEIRGLTIPSLDDEARAFLLEGELAETRPRVELAPTHLDTLGEIQRQTGLSRSEVIRRCVLRHLNRVTKDYSVIQGWRKNEIRITWEEVEAGLKRPRLRCFDLLQRRFVDERERTERKIAADSGGFKRFADEYLEGFRGSEAYKQLIEVRDEQPFSNLEELIVEYTEYIESDIRRIAVRPFSEY